MDPEPTPSDIYPRRDEYNSEKKKKTSQAKKVSPLWVGLIERPRTLYTHTFSSVCIYILEWKKGKEKKRFINAPLNGGLFAFLPIREIRTVFFGPLWRARYQYTHTYIRPRYWINQILIGAKAQAFFGCLQPTEGRLSLCTCDTLSLPEIKKIQQSADEVYKKRRNCWLGNIDAPKGNK